MNKDASGQWGIGKVTRGEASAPAAAPAVNWRSQANLASDLSGPDTVSVCINTTKGDICIKLVPSWAPEGVKRFLDMVDDGFYSEVAMYRAIAGFLVQFGVAKHAQKTYDKIRDDPRIGIPIEEGSVCFA